MSGTSKVVGVLVESKAGVVEVVERVQVWPSPYSFSRQSRSGPAWKISRLPAYTRPWSYAMEPHPGLASWVRGEMRVKAKARTKANSNYSMWWYDIGRKPGWHVQGSTNSIGTCAVSWCWVLYRTCPFSSKISWPGHRINPSRNAENTRGPHNVWRFLFSLLS